MADVFISYSRKDRDRVRVLAQAFEAEGLSVWWDPEITPGSTFDEVIDEELDGARCVVVAWSEASRESRWVREEATDALEAEKLIPVWIEKVPLPRGFKLIQSEDLSDWTGDRKSEPWQRIMIQANALTGREGQNSPGWRAPLEEHEFGNAAESPPEDPGGENRSGMGLLTIVGAILITALWFYGDSDENALLKGAGAFAALVFLLFRFADTDLSPSLKAMASRWFLPVEGQVKVNVIEGFNNLFESVFGRRHWSWKCLWRSAVASTMALALTLFLSDPSLLIVRELLPRELSKGIFFFLLVIVFNNLFGDFLSLFETRLLLRLAQRRASLIVPSVLLDAILTPIVFAGEWRVPCYLCESSLPSFRISWESISLGMRSIRR